MKNKFTIIGIIILIIINVILGTYFLTREIETNPREGVCKAFCNRRSYEGNYSEEEKTCYCNIKGELVENKLLY